MINQQTLTANNLNIEIASALEDYYDLGRTIGRGEFAKVKLARCLHTQQLVAIKIVRIDARGDRLLREISILGKLEHPNIIKLMRVLQLPDRIAMVMEYASGGEVFDYVQSKGHLSQNRVRSIMIQIFKGKMLTLMKRTAKDAETTKIHNIIAVDYMHKNGVIHRDLKLENLLCLYDDRVAITDFGFATNISSPDKVLQTACGSPCYAAPELVLCKKGYVGPPADLWSCGVIMYAMSYGFLPFESDVQLDHSDNDSVIWTPSNVYQLYQHIATNPLRLPKTPIDGLDEAGRNLLLKLLDFDSTTRITMDSVWSHAWITATD